MKKLLLLSTLLLFSGTFSAQDSEAIKSNRVTAFYQAALVLIFYYHVEQYNTY